MGYDFFHSKLASSVLKGILILISSISFYQNMYGQIADNYHWKKRVLLLFASNETDSDFKKQLSILTQKPTEVTDRDLIYYEIFSETGWNPNHTTISRAESLAFRKKYLIEKEGFTVILVGKDGTEKLRRRKPVSLEDLFQLIDRMPMRKAEIGTW